MDPIISSDVAAITPVNGDHTIDGNEVLETTSPIDEKAITDRYFREGNNNPAVTGTTKLTKPIELAWMRRRMESADAKYAQISAELEKVTRILKTKMIAADKKGEMRKLEPSEKVTFTENKRVLGLNKRIAKQTYLEKKREYKLAAENNFRVKATGNTAAWNETRYLQVIDSVLTHAMEALTDAGTNGHAEEVKQLRKLALESKRKEFNKATTALLIKLNKYIWEKTLQYKRVDSELMRLVYKKFRN